MTRIVLLATAFLGAAAMPSSQAPPAPSSAHSPLPSGLHQLADFFSSSSGVVDAHSYRTTSVERGDIVTTVQAAGTLNALVVVEVGSQISGLVKELYADFNSSVTEGQVIARVEPDIYEARVTQTKAELEMAETLVSVQRAQIARFRAELDNAQAKFASASAQTTRAEVAVDSAAQELERKRPLAERKVISAGEWEHDRTAHKSAEAQVTAARADEVSQAATIRAAQATLSMAEAQLANTLAQVTQKQAILRQAQIDLERTYIRSPVTGTVVNRAVSGGQTLAASLQSPVLFTIAQDLTQMQVEASVVEADISRFSMGQPVTFTVDAYPERIFTGSVKQIRKAPKIVQNIVTYIVVIAAENPDELLLPGMTANLEVVVAQRRNVLKVPNAALRFRPGREGPDGIPIEATLKKSPGNGTTRTGSIGHAFVLGASGEPQPVTVRIGITDGRMSEILTGDLTEGQPVITGVAAAPGRNAEASSVLVRFRLQ
ncbi:efflux RND transporter periplasmic adaptor subunit [Phyllobacterium brassicacearum]|uniref:Efflux RND transporter periplasmic adaptor subunit n=1 Tax=Phyllobacterium brassicacearum TaxID=314235 RepID=A0A2P7BCU0_9HYPH|nr:efflux RND transporter periplasmic adaptor subunit [Phyllobacterium brassicacearum]PSH64266.1 efflux RND transporter periplasmic adaptor subunit [Phyllobacterium brassicacearum]TDQ16207.1 HlyD family secretion protein [Phyllobacterium brassicacearum]